MAKHTPKPEIGHVGGLPSAETLKNLGQELGRVSTGLPEIDVAEFQRISAGVDFGALKLLSDDWNRINAEAISRLGSLSSLAYPGHVYAPETTQLNREIVDLQERIAHQAEELRQAKTSSREYEKQNRELRDSYEALRQRQELGFVLERIQPSARTRLLEPESVMRQRFLGGEAHDAFVLALDIRRSTELMLRARSPQAFAEFTTALCTAFTKIILDGFGVFDKFTGDGVLAFFPEFYTGSDAAYRVLKAAEQCHATFRAMYTASRKLFKSVLLDVGLGIGIDHGPVHLVQIAGGLTAVGEPVVHACRLSSAPAGITLLNQPAYEKVLGSVGLEHCVLTEHAHIVKHEGTMAAYAATLNAAPYTPVLPEWADEATAQKAPADTSTAP